MTYTAYGQGRHHWLFDVDGDGDVDNPDLFAIVALSGTPINDAAYRSECDTDRNGKIDSDDWAAWSVEAALAFGLISDPSSGGVDNQLGYDGYVFNTETQEYLARNRFYEPELGRWLQRDPAGYVDGMNLYEYVGGRPTILTDSTGLGADDDDDDKCCKCLEVTWKFKLVGTGTSPIPKWTSYNSETPAGTRVGFRIVAQFRVMGNYKKCKYIQEEVGKIRWRDIDGPHEIRGRVNRINLDKAKIAKRSKGVWFITHIDPLGVDYKEGGLRIDLDLVVKLRCEGSDGKVVTSSPESSFSLLGGTDAIRKRPNNRAPYIKLFKTSLKYNGKVIQ